MRIIYSRNEKFHGDYKKADVFSVGVIIYEMLNGAKPFTEELLLAQQASLTHQRTGAKEEILMKYVQEMLKWSFRDRCDAGYARKCFGPKVCKNNIYMTSKKGGE